jgi:hypothetical protein
MSWALGILATEGMPRSAVLTIIVIVGIALMGVVWFALKFWLASTRPPNIQEIRTPNLDRINQQALEVMGRQEEDDDDDVPEGLKDVVPEDQRDEPA